jgi:endonuclease YncB( thermonuclease family)
LTPPFEALDAKTFTTGDWEVILAEVEGPNRGAVCFDRDGRLFGCGLRARAALTNALGRGPVICQSRADYGHQGMTADCQVDGTDLAQRLIELGWLRPIGATSQARESARREAEAAGRGMWNGGWRVR